VVSVHLCQARIGRVLDDGLVNSHQRKVRTVTSREIPNSHRCVRGKTGGASDLGNAQGRTCPFIASIAASLASKES
jgi:hypothetical protein